MARDKMKIITKLFLPVFPCLLIVSCSSIDRQVNLNKKEIQIPAEARQARPQLPPAAVPKTPDFMPAAVDASPIKTRIVDITARKTPLRDVLHVIAEATSLNLVMEKGVDPETEVNLNLKNVTAEYALNTVFAAADYFYRIEDNLLVVKAVDTKIFELGHPPMTQAYSVDVGGDILGGAMDINPSGSGGGGGGGSTSMKGNVTQSVKSDEAAYKFWDSIETSLSKIIGGQASGSGLTINRLTGTIYATGSKKELQKVEYYLNTVRKAIGRQVIIEAKVIEVQLQDDFQFGINWSMVGEFVSGATTGSNNYSFKTSNFTSVVDGTGPLFAIEGTAVFGKDSLNYVLNALQQQGDVRTLSNPKLNIMNGQTAMLSVGRNQAYISKVETTISGGTTTAGQTITYTVDTNSILSGTMIGILPFINESGEISLTVTPIVSDLVKLTTQKIGSVSSTQAVEIQLPTVDLREMSTTVKVKNGDVIAIGGLMSKQEKLVDNQVPFLGNVPGLGYLFKSRDKKDRKTELVVIIQPVLVNM